MWKLFVFVIIFGASFSGSVVDGKRRRRVNFDQKTSPTPASAISQNEPSVRNQRGILGLSSYAYDANLFEQHARATSALIEATQNAQAAQLLVDNLKNMIQQQQDPTMSGVQLVDQYGNFIGNTANQPSLLDQIGHQNIKLNSPSMTQKLPQEQNAGAEFSSSDGALQNGYLPPAAATVPTQQQDQMQQQILTYHQPTVIQHQPLFQQIIASDGSVFLQPILEQPTAVAVPVPAPQSTIYHHPQPVEVVQEQPLLIPTLPVSQVVPVKKIVQPLVDPVVKLLRQPILPPAVFQKELFALKNPPVRVLTYSDLCTVYPYQRKLSICVYKKATLPELHHPDIQLVPEQKNVVEAPGGGDVGTEQKNVDDTDRFLDKEQKNVDDSNGDFDGLGPELKNIDKESEFPFSKGDNKMKKEGGAVGDSIQEILKQQRLLLRQFASANRALALQSSSGSEDEVAIVSEEETEAEASNTKQKLVIKTAEEGKNKGESGETSTTEKSSTEMSKPKTKRRSGNNRNLRKQNKKSSKSSSSKATTHQPFNLA